MMKRLIGTDARELAIDELMFAFLAIGHEDEANDLLKLESGVPATSRREEERTCRYANLLAQHGHLAEAMNLLTPISLDRFLLTISGWASEDEQKSFLPYRAFRDAIRIAGWVDGYWESILNMMKD